MSNIYRCAVCGSGIPLEVKAVVRRDERGRVILFHPECVEPEDARRAEGG